MDEKFHQERAAEILFQISKKASVDRINQKVENLSKSASTTSPTPRAVLPKQKQKEIDDFFANPENVKKLEKRFNKNLKEILKYLLKRKQEKKNQENKKL